MAVYRKNETWWIDFYYQGKRHRQKIGTKKKDAEDALNQIKVKIAAGDFVPMEDRKKEEELAPQSILFETFSTDEFLPWSQTEHSENHYARLEIALRVHLMPVFGDKYLHEITTKMIEDYKATRSRSHYRRGSKTKPVSEATINREICCIKVILRKVVEWGRIEDSPAQAVKTLKEKPNPTRLLEQYEIARLLEATPDRLRALIACTVYAGLRYNELLHLHWKDIDWNTRELHVISRREHHTKNYQSRRIPINDALVESLRRHPRHINRPYVFCNKDGQPLKNVRRALRYAAKRAGIEDAIKMHQLRHTFCSHALMQGIDPRTVQKWMGHKDLNTTLRYAHVSPDHEKAAIQQLRYDHGHYMDTKAESE